MTPQPIMNEARQLPREQLSELFDLMLAESFAQPDPELDAARRPFGPAFPYAIVYLDRPDALWVAAVMHFERRPG